MGKPRRYTDEEELQIAGLYMQGVGAPALAKMFAGPDGHHSTIYRALRRLGIPTRTRQEVPFVGKFIVGDYVWLRVFPEDPIGWAMTYERGDERYPYVLEHRLVMARRLGRPLTTKEQVHHVDGVGTNNDPSNLQLRHGSHGAGAAFRCQDCGSDNVRAVELADIPNGAYC